MANKLKHEPLPGFDPQEVAFNCEAVRGFLLKHGQKARRRDEGRKAS